MRTGTTEKGHMPTVRIRSKHFINTWFMFIQCTTTESRTVLDVLFREREIRHYQGIKLKREVTAEYLDLIKPVLGVLSEKNKEKIEDMCKLT